MKNFVKVVTILIPFLPIPIFFLVKTDSHFLIDYLIYSWILALFVLIYYFHKIYHNNTITKENKSVWVLFLLMLPNIAQVIYWTKHIRKT